MGALGAGGVQLANDVQVYRLALGADEETHRRLTCQTAVHRRGGGA